MGAEVKMYERRVAKGAALLDEKKPNWWNGKKKPTIDLATLDLRSTCNCVLGQVFRPRSEVFPYKSGYTLGLEELGLNGVDGGYGFDGLNYSELHSRWRELIRRRRKAAGRRR